MSIFDKFNNQPPQQPQQQPQYPPQSQPQQQPQYPPQSQPPMPGGTPFDRIGSSDARQGGIYPLPGVYPVLYVDVVKMIVSRKSEYVFIAEFDVLKSEVEARPAGTRMSWAVNFRHDASPGNVKAFIAAVMNVPAQEVDSRSAQAACSEVNPCHGRLVRLEASQTLTKQNTEFTLCNWRPIPDEYQAHAEELRREAGFASFAYEGTPTPF